MRMRGLLIAVVLLAALAGGVYWSNKSKEAAANKPAADAAPKILTIPEAEITRVEIRKTGAEPTVVERKSGKWELVAPKPLAADQDAMNSVASTLSALNADRLIEEKAGDVGQYGLATPAVEVLVARKGGQNRDLLIGDEVPTGSGFYAKLRDDPRVFTIASYTKTSLEKNESDLRDKRLLTFDSDKLTRLELAVKGQDIEFGKNNQNDWQILKPKPMRADGGRVEELVMKLRDAKMEPASSDEDTKNAAGAFTSGTQVATARVTDAAGTQQLQIKKDKANNYYARSSVVEGTYKLASDVGSAFDKSLDDLRNRKVFDFGWSDPSKLDIRDGAKQVVYTKPGDRWTANGKAMDSTSIQLVVDKLRDLSATAFPDKGFSTPAMQFTVVSNEGKRTENVALSKNGNDWFAKRDNEPTVYQLDAKVVEELQRAIAGVKEAAPVKQGKK